MPIHLTRPIIIKPEGTKVSLKSFHIEFSPPMIVANYSIEDASGNVVDGRSVSITDPVIVRAFLSASIPSGVSLGSYLKKRLFSYAKQSHPELDGTEDTTIPQISSSTQNPKLD